jgi:hypothetical protein
MTLTPQACTRGACCTVITLPGADAGVHARQELERLETLTGNADFMPLLEEYAKDLADPEARSR